MALLTQLAKHTKKNLTQSPFGLNQPPCNLNHHITLRMNNPPPRWRRELVLSRRVADGSGGSTGEGMGNGDGWEGIVLAQGWSGGAGQRKRDDSGQGADGSG